MDNLGKIENTIKYLGFGDAFDKTLTLDNSAPEMPFAKEYDPTVRPWYIGAINKNGVFVSDVFVHAATKEPIVTLSVAVKKDGILKGVLVALLDFTEIHNIVESYKIGQNGNFFLVDSNYDIIKGSAEDQKNFDYISKKDLFKETHTDIKVDTPNGVKLFHIKKIGGLNLVLVGVVNEDDLYSEITELKGYIVYIGFGFIIFILVFLSFISKSFDKSLDRLKYVIDSISNGNYTKDIDKITHEIKEDNELNFIKTALKTMSDEIVKREDQLRYISETDPLTKCANRRSIIEKIESAVDRSNRFQTTFTLIMFDLDKFKRVNDNYGHLFGDEVLRGVTKAINENLRGSDILGRYGGEEFLILLPNTELDEGIETAERLRIIVEKLVWDIDITITISMGVIRNLPKDNLDLSLERVDNLLYKAKNNGRNRVEAQKFMPKKKN
jgi:diguanylate cyclase (GGDEF)-like protein